MVFISKEFAASFAQWPRYKINSERPTSLSPRCPRRIIGVSHSQRVFHHRYQYYRDRERQKNVEKEAKHTKKINRRNNSSGKAYKVEKKRNQYVY